ncbi:phosphotransferase family protein [Ramlibacter algicola]|uniref:Phosphotransferase n=1 Tax=Ramlibacter algicola TaxID=2795217 RepID=A0A934PZS5_9BURK|nr:phosphotransferase [Ramlibacter algicola]MBK0393454.1 phosphotransferase [Ramlibacter algicola]
MPIPDLGQDAAALRQLMVRLGLAAEGDPVDAIPLAGGVSSGIYRVRLRGGDVCVKQALPKLKVAKDWFAPVERVFHEAAYLREAAAIVPVHVPRVLADDRETCSMAMEFLGARHLNWKAELLAGRVDVAMAGTVGDVLGRIHAATAGQPRLAEAFATDANFHAIRLEPYLVESARVHPALADRLLSLVHVTASTRRVLVHGDVSPKNILLGPAGPVLLDAECAWYGDPAFDLAFCLNHFLLKAAHLPAHARSLLDGAAAFIGGYWPHVHWERREDLDARTAALLPGLSLARVDGKSPVEYLDAPTREAVRREALELLRSSAADLQSLLRRWESAFLP